MLHNEFKLVPFNSQGYYSIKNDFTINDAKYSPVIKMEAEGTLLVAAYYADKYQCVISRPADISVDELAKLNSEERRFHYLTDWEFVDNILDLLKPARETHDQEYREAFILGPGTAHNIPVIYLREKGEEAILYANTLAIHTASCIPEFSDTLKRKHNINVYVVEETRQADIYSCGVDALAFAKDAVAINKRNGKYRIENLLTQLKARATRYNNYYSVRLPNELLKTAQISKFVDLHQENNSKKIHKNETLAEFRKRYTYENVEMGQQF